MLGKRQVKDRGDEAAVGYLPWFDRVHRLAVPARVSGSKVQQVLIASTASATRSPSTGSLWTKMVATWAFSLRLSTGRDNTRMVP
jgi:hypothetical protein